MSVKKPSTMPKQLRNKEKVVSWISEITGADKGSVEQRLLAEHNESGTNVSEAFRETGLERYVWCDEMGKFYEQTDAFLYELVIWNRNRLKRRFRRCIKRYLNGCNGKRKKVLCLGDGLGFDSAYLAEAGYEVSYFELPGYQLSFAERVFAETAGEVTVITDADDIAAESFDAVVCLDVLEHVAEPGLFVRQTAGYLKEGGWLIVHAPFFMIHPSKPTHLKANRRYSGSLSLYRENGFRLIDGKGCWNPIVLEKSGNGVLKGEKFSLKVLGLRASGLCLCVGRFFAWPFYWVIGYQQKRNDWFAE